MVELLRPECESRPSGETGPASDRVAATSTTVADAADHLAHFRARVLVGALLDGWSIHNERQALRWEASRPRPGDWLGRSSAADQRIRWNRMTAIAEAHRNRASIAPLEELGTDLLHLLGEGGTVAC